MAPMIISLIVLAGLWGASPSPGWHEEVIPYAKAIDVATIDQRLPKKRLDKWLIEVFGPTAKVAWSASQCDLKLDFAEPSEGYPLCAEVQAVLPKKKVTVQVLVGTLRKGIVGKPSLHAAYVLDIPKVQPQSVEHGLADLPGLLSGSTQ
jgi:hypothetical protein